MRALACSLAILVVPARASAENFVQVGAGLMLPVADDDWNDYVDEGLKLAARVGGTGSSDGMLGGMLSVDWTPINVGDLGLGNLADVSADRFRIQVLAFTQRPLASKAVLDVRVGGGIDISHVNVQTNLGALSSENSDTDIGLALEAGAGLWFDMGSLQVGGEFGLPVSFHADGMDNNIDLNDYMSLDVDLLFGVRFVSH